MTISWKTFDDAERGHSQMDSPRLEDCDTATIQLPEQTR